MDSGHHVRSKRGFNKLSALFGDAKFRAEQCLSGSGAESHYHIRLNYGDLSFEPGTASRDFRGIRFLVDAAFAPRLPLKMFDNISDVGLGAIDTSFGERIIE